MTASGVRLDLFWPQIQGPKQVESDLTSHVVWHAVIPAYAGIQSWASLDPRPSAGQARHPPG
jgi:hypothetical protein